MVLMADGGLMNLSADDAQYPTTEARSKKNGWPAHHSFNRHRREEASVLHAR
jgi:hypothetical protein